MVHSNVLIVGGGPAGSSVAWALRNSGLSVRILDKQRFPRDKTCAGWVTPAVLEALQIDLADYRRTGRTLQPITGFRIGLMQHSAIENNHGPGAISYGIRRCEFDDFLLQRSGAQVETGIAVDDLHWNGQRWTVNDCYSADLLIGAGGHFCPVARRLGAKLGQLEQVVAAKEIEFAMSASQQARCPVWETVPELYFCEDLKGYAWVFRKGHYLNVGLGREDNRQLSEHLKRFVEWLQREGRLPDDLPTRFKGHAYILYDHGERNLAGHHALLVGDAAGLAYTQSGEGIRPAVESALLAANCIEKLNGDYSAVRLRSYAEALQRRFGARANRKILSVGLPSSLKIPAAKALMRSGWFTRTVVTERWFLHSHQQPLAV